MICYLGLGSNLKTPERQIRQGIQNLKKIPGVMVIQTSKLYFNQAVGRRGQPQYCNSVVKIKTNYSPKLLLKRCLALEKQQGRVRKVRWGARTLDIDILLYGNRKLNTAQLTIPHPRMFERDFVMVPLLHLKSLHHPIPMAHSTRL